jgi:hypothetical protein
LDRFGPNAEISQGLLFDSEPITWKPSVQNLVQKSVQKTVQAIISKVADL